MNRHSSATFPACRSDREGWSGLQRLQGRKPACSASAAVRWNATFSGRAARAAHDGRQYTPVVLTEKKNLPSARGSRATTAAHRGSLSVAAASISFRVILFILSPLASIDSMPGL
jgi:hypothetical protein